MRLRLAAALACLPSLAAAGPFSVGAGLGLTESAATANTGSSSDTTYSLFGRLALTPQIAAQLEISRIDTPNDQVDTRVYGGLLIGSLGHGALVPIVLAGGGLDRATLGGNLETDAHHFEGGLGLELHSRGGAFIAVDARLGSRTLDSMPIYPAPVLCPQGGGCGTPPMMASGDYRSVRISAALQF